MESDFIREQHILDLAVKLHLGTATAAEQLEAANNLSHSTGVNLRLQQRLDALETAMAFFLRVMKIFQDIDQTDQLFWNTSGQYAPLTFFAMCSDTFAWATADAEEITFDNLHVLEQSVEDVKATRNVSLYWAVTLFCARVRGRQPMERIRLPQELQAMFAAVEL